MGQVPVVRSDQRPDDVHPKWVVFDTKMEKIGGVSVNPNSLLLIFVLEDDLHPNWVVFNPKKMVVKPIDPTRIQGCVQNDVPHRSPQP